MATLIKQHGRFFLQFYHPDRIPKRKRVALLTGIKHDAESLKVKLERDYLFGEFNPWRDDPFTYDREIPAQLPHTLKEAVASFIAQKKATNATPNTIRSYDSVLGLFCNAVGEGRLLSEVKPSDLAAFIRDRKLSEATQHNRFRHVKAFFRWCVYDELIEANPLRRVKAPKLPKKLPKHVTEQELGAICEAVRKEYNANCGNDKCRTGEILWYIPLFRFAFYTGMRSSELARLRWEHIDTERGLIYIREQKNGTEQTHPLNRKAAEILQSVPKGNDQDYVFRSPRITTKLRSVQRFVETVSRAFTHYRKVAKIKRHVTFHGLRHGHLTLLAERGKSAFVIQAAGRHGDVSTSQKYVHLANEYLKKELDEVFA